MGIKNLHTILKDYAPMVYNQKHLSEYAYKKVGIDISLYLYKFKASVGDRWMESFLNMVVCLRSWDIHCLFVYDGPAPPEKLEEQQRRRAECSKRKEKMQGIEVELETYYKDGTVGELMLSVYNKIKEKPPSKLKLSSDNQPIAAFDINIFLQRFNDIKDMIISITNDDIDNTKKMFDILQVPWVIAPCEAERYACRLCYHGIIDAVLSEDTDVLCYQTPIFMTKFNIYDNTVVEIEYEDVLKEIDMKRESFLDMCIMLGCDYNDNIPKIGMKNAYALIKEFESIEECVKHLQKKDPSINGDILKYETCRRLFSQPIVKPDFYVKYCGTPDFQQLEKFFLEHHIKHDMEKIKKALNHREIIFEN